MYFVRHGETLLNRRNVHQSPNTPLSPRGVEQARSVAEVLRGVSPDLLLTSEYTRARETAGIIGMSVGVAPVVNPLFYEITRPSSLYGLSHFHPRTLSYVAQSVLKKNDISWRYEDAENFNDISTRAKRALEYLESLTPQHHSVVVVSHTVFINIMIAYSCYDRMLTIPDLLPTFLHVKRMKNTHIAHLEYSPTTRGHLCAWVERSAV